MSFTLSPNMLLRVPAIGDEQGPDYATDINFDLNSVIDTHDHTPGRGVQITPAGLNINTSLPVNNNLITSIAGLTLSAQSVTPGVNTIYESGVDLFFVDGVGNNIRITQSGGIAGTPGSIGGLVPPASVTYIPGSQTFVFESNTSVAANLDAGSLLMRNLSPNSTFALTLAPPSALASNYTITLPLLPASPSFVTIDASGNMSAAPLVLGALTTSNLSASANILGSQLDPSAGIVGNQIAASTITGANIVSSIDLPGNTVQENGKNVIVANTNAASSLAMIQGTVSTTGVVLNGEGFTSSNISTGVYDLAWVSALGGAPVLIATTYQAPFVCFITSTSTSGARLEIRNSTNNVLTNSQFNFIAIGQRA